MGLHGHLVFSWLVDGEHSNTWHTCIGAMTSLGFLGGYKEVGDV